MKIAILTFEGFNELDSLVAYSILNRVKSENWQVQITSPTPTVTSMNGLTISAHQPLAYANQADAVIIGSGSLTRQIVADQSLMSTLTLSPQKQLIATQCSGVLLLPALGILDNASVCTDLTTQPWAMDAGLVVLEQPFHASESVATAGGCLASQYLATWLIAKLASVEAAKNAIHYVAPVGEKEDTVNRCLSVVEPYLD
ncbi:DJ-1/PfpI family protein [Photobacterium sp. CAU 1568]|uniref:DJ-1/PfpI family protein n=1 Tax=Photobacterium arenosum TaxID=2774143 RepID=A0ABR9BPC7_9GAMM|nr:DJ-1/PfpI family protein [Photobacterium arenosum]MBD8514084.1 DJ-1/PfpI family protein [Photobacterium arenosum]